MAEQVFLETWIGRLHLKVDGLYIVKDLQGCGHIRILRPCLDQIFQVG